MKKEDVKYIILHCSASDHLHHDDISVIEQWHFERNFSEVGYNYFITKNGDIQTGRPELKPGAHCKGYNDISLGICFSGLDYFTTIQSLMGHSVVLSILDDYPNIERVYYHNELNPNKTCPNTTFAFVDTVNKLLRRKWGNDVGK